MTIHQGMCEAFKRFGASQDGIEAVMKKTDAAFPLAGMESQQEDIPPGWEEEFITAYMQFTAFICEDGPVREHLKQELQNRVARN